MNAAISVIIPAYGRHQLISRCLQSVASVNTPDGRPLELILVDDGSTPALDVELPANASLIRRDTNGGAAAARNTGIEAASGDLIAFLDSDDAWLPNKLNNQIALFDVLSQRHDPDLLVIGSGFYDPDRKTGKLRARLPKEASGLDMFASGCWFAPGSTMLLSRRAFEIVGPQDQTLRRLEDLDWFIRFGEAGGKFFRTPTYDAVIHPSGEAPFGSVMQAAAQLTSKYAPWGTAPLPPSAWNRLAAYLSLEKAVAHLGSQQYVSGAIELVKTLIRKPRLQPAVERFWIESTDVPAEVKQVFADLVKTRE